MSTEQFIITEYRRDKRRAYYVAAKPGHYRSRDGSQVPDSSTGGPEWTENREHALRFKTHRSAARVKSLCPSAVIIPA